MKRTKTNTYLQNLIDELKMLSAKEDVNIWKKIAFDLEKPTRQRGAVNLSKINRVTKEDETIVVPGKVLASGSLEHKLVIAAYQFSGQAMEKIKNSESKAMTIKELIQKNPKGSNVRVVG